MCESDNDKIKALVKIDACPVLCLHGSSVAIGHCYVIFHSALYYVAEECGENEDKKMG